VRRNNNTYKNNRFIIASTTTSTSTTSTSTSTTRTIHTTTTTTNSYSNSSSYNYNSSNHPHTLPVLWWWWWWRCGGGGGNRAPTNRHGVVVPRRGRSTAAAPPRTVPEALDERVRSGDLLPDRAQVRVAKRLARLQEALAGYDHAAHWVARSEHEGRQPHRPKGERDRGNGGRRDPSSPTPPRPASVRSAATGSRSPSPPHAPGPGIPRGLYIHGRVGTGKTMLMDCFYENARVGGGNKKRRLHFYDFLSEIHSRIHALKRADLARDGRNFSVDTSLSKNPVHRVGLEFSSEVSLLCLDEFQVTDVADALILSQLFSVLFAGGTVVVATSNRPPRDLYEGGLNRSYFLPFLDLLEAHCITYHIPSRTDYRRILSADSVSSPVSVSESGSFFLVGRQSHRSLEDLVSRVAERLVDGEAAAAAAGATASFATPRSMELPVGFRRRLSVGRVYGRSAADTAPPPTKTPTTTTIPATTTDRTMARFSFGELCDTDKGASDYRAIARAFDVVVLEDVPAMDPGGHNRARRFVTLIDELYEGRCALVCAVGGSGERAAAPAIETPADLFSAGSSALPGGDDADGAGAPNNGNEDGGDEQQRQRQLSSPPPPPPQILGIDAAREGGTPVGALASVRELSFAFERSSSRIFEMCSRPWWDRVLGKRVW